jgi:plasmid maintenance system antidote protein VapI
LTDLLRSAALRLARAAGGGVEFWLGLPISELAKYMVELAAQLEDEKEAD